MTLTEFLLARIGEDEADAKADSDHQARWTTGRVLAECQAKRRAIAHHGTVASTQQATLSLRRVSNRVLRHLAAVYADHSDYREEWRL